jgi:hypothetical protein
MTNQEIIAKIYKLQLLLKGKNAPIANALERATIPLIEHEGALATASREEVMKIRGIGDATVGLIMQVIEGKHVYEIAASVPKPKRREPIKLP